MGSEDKGHDTYRKKRRLAALGILSPKLHHFAIFQRNDPVVWVTKSVNGSWKMVRQ
jgi:hypothetical protein